MLVVRFALAALLLLVGAPRAYAQTPTYAADAVWNWGDHLEAIAALCDVAVVFELRPEDSAADAGCIEYAMAQLGASDSARRFFESTGQFLVQFEERGGIDVGVASSPWLNMGRGEAVLLNGLPAAIPMSRAIDWRDESWKSLPGYAELVRRTPYASPWLEYGGALGVQSEADGSVTVPLAFDMRECRACPNLATFRADLRFAPGGYIDSVTIQPPGPARP